MSDNNTPQPDYGDPVEEPRPVDNVVDRANEALAEAQAAREDVVASDSPPLPDSTVAPATAATPAPLDAPAAADEPDWRALDEVMAKDAAAAAAALPDSPVAAEVPNSSARAVADASPAQTRAAAKDVTSTDAAAHTKTAWYDTPEVTESTANLPEEVQTVTVVPLTPPAVEDDPVLTGTAPAQPIFVQAPEPPVVRGNRAAAGLIGLLAAVVFAVLYLAARLGFSGINLLDVEALRDETIAQVTSLAMWTPVIVFFLAFWLLGAFINRGRWGYWVIFGILVGFAAYAGHAIGAIVEAGPWQITWTEALALAREQALAPAALAALVIGRELPVWFGGWIAKRGRHVTEQNAEAQAEYERTLEAGPQFERVT